MERHRIFIAINLPEEIKEELMSYQDKCFELPAKWTKKENLHITLEFLGSVFDKDMPNVFIKAQELASKTPSFIIKLDKISYFPNNNLPKYIFATGGKYHVTLARIREWQWKQINLEDRPNIEEDIDSSFKVESIEVMESFLKRGGPEYKILQSFSLK